MRRWTHWVTAASAAVATVAAAAAFFNLARNGGARSAVLLTYWEIPPFHLVDQNGDTLRSSDLLGRPWVASFIFTNCPGVCPLISARMARIRDVLRSEGRLGLEVRLVSFTVVPSRNRSWDHGADVNARVMHASRLILVDAEGVARGTYDATQGIAVARVLQDLRRLGAW